MGARERERGWRTSGDELHFSSFFWFWSFASWRDARDETSIRRGQYSSPVRVISFNTVEGWSRDVSEGVAPLRVRCANQGRETPAFVERYEGACGGVQLAPPLS